MFSICICLSSSVAGNDFPINRSGISCMCREQLERKRAGHWRSVPTRDWNFPGSPHECHRLFFNSLGHWRFCRQHPYLQDVCLRSSICLSRDCVSNSHSQSINQSTFIVKNTAQYQLNEYIIFLNNEGWTPIGVCVLSLFTSGMKDESMPCRDN